MLLEERLSDHKLIFTLPCLVVEHTLNVSSTVVIELNIKFGEHHHLVQVKIVIQIVVECILEKTDVPSASINLES